MLPFGMAHLVATLTQPHQHAVRVLRDVVGTVVSSLQFHIPRRAADAVNFPALRARARATGVQRASIEYSTRAAGSDRTRVTCSREMALVLIEELLAVANQAEVQRDADLLIDCATGARAAFDASHIRPVRS